MEPAIATGDVVVNRPIAPLDARVGDVITFRDPGDASRFITHRVRHIRARDGRVAFVTKGDANNSTERWAVPVDGEIGRVDYRVPRLGYALFWTRGRYAKLGLITIPALLLGAMTLGRIWGLRRRDLSRGLTA
jgi:signal peptidase